MEKRSNHKFSYEQAEELILQQQLTDVYQSGFSANEEKTKKDKKKS